MSDETNKKTADNGKGDAPRNNFSEEYRANYDAIQWKPKKQKTKEEEER